jgi:hypothetical protein
VRIEIFENLMPIGLTSVSLNIERASSWTPWHGVRKLRVPGEEFWRKVDHKIVARNETYAIAKEKILGLFPEIWPARSRGRKWGSWSEAQTDSLYLKYIVDEVYHVLQLVDPSGGEIADFGHFRPFGCDGVQMSHNWNWIGNSNLITLY